jgi:gliding motility-associated-like protein
MSISVDATGEYCVEITNSFGCVGEACHSVTELSLPEVNAGPDVTICVGDSATLLAVGGGQNAVYVWYQDGIVIDTAQSITVASGTADGFTEYMVKLHTTFCTYIDTDVVKVWTYAAPVAGFERDPAGIVFLPAASISFKDTSSGQVTDWAWSFGDGNTSMLPNPNHSYLSADFFTVTLMVSNNGCMDSISKMVEVQEPSISIDVFTPNNDGINDVIWIDGGLTSLYELTFFNRWGHQLWTGQGRAFGWDGKTSAGVDCEVGTYYYVLERNDQDTGNTSTQTGFVSLLR